MQWAASTSACGRPTNASGAARCDVARRPPSMKTCRRPGLGAGEVSGPTRASSRTRWPSCPTLRARASRSSRRWCATPSARRPVVSARRAWSRSAPQSARQRGRPAPGGPAGRPGTAGRASYPQHVRPARRHDEGRVRRPTGAAHALRKVVQSMTLTSPQPLNAPAEVTRPTANSRRATPRTLTRLPPPLRGAATEQAPSRNPDWDPLDWRQK